MTVGPLIAAGGLLWPSFLTADDSYWTEVLPGHLLLGAGLSLEFVPMQNAALAGIGPRDSGVASAAVTATQQIGGSMGAGGVHRPRRHGRHHLHRRRAPHPTALVDGYPAVFLAAAAAVVLVRPWPGS